MAGPRILHLIESISRGGGTRAAITTAKYIQGSFPSEHFISPLAMNAVDLKAISLVEESGLTLLRSNSMQELHQLIAEADLVHFHWWNSSAGDLFVRSKLPACRLVVWCHVGGHLPPHIIPDQLFDFADCVVACSPHTYAAPAFRKLPVEARLAKTAMVYGPADFERLGTISQSPHESFNVGYIGTVCFSKMHRRYVAMSANAKIPNARFIVCGLGSASDVINREAATLGGTDKFELKGFIDDIRPILQTIDVFGYPLCEDNYSGSEITLQEAMYAGLPIVAFPYGGVSRLLIDSYSGLLVHSETEYTSALEFLFHHPEERARLGENAKRYARQILGTERTAHAFVEIYQKLLHAPKRARHEWSTRPTRHPVERLEASDRFIDSLGEWGEPFFLSKHGATLDLQLSGDSSIQKMSPLMRIGGLLTWLRANPLDPFLAFWAGLASLANSPASKATQLLRQAAESGFPHWRISWYSALAAVESGELSQSRQALQSLEAVDPHFPGLASLKARIEQVDRGTIGSLNR